MTSSLWLSYILVSSSRKNDKQHSKRVIDVCLHPVISSTNREHLRVNDTFQEFDVRKLRKGTVPCKLYEDNKPLKVSFLRVLRVLLNLLLIIWMAGRRMTRIEFFSLSVTWNVSPLKTRPDNVNKPLVSCHINSFKIKNNVLLKSLRIRL